MFTINMDFLQNVLPRLSEVVAKTSILRSLVNLTVDVLPKYSSQLLISRAARSGIQTLIKILRLFFPLGPIKIQRASADLALRLPFGSDPPRRFGDLEQFQEN
jgi:hypothetical protein